MNAYDDIANVEAAVAAAVAVAATENIHPKWNVWARNWLGRINRSADAARAVQHLPSKTISPELPPHVYSRLAIKAHGAMAATSAAGYLGVARLHTGKDRENYKRLAMENAEEALACFRKIDF